MKYRLVIISAVVVAVLLKYFTIVEVVGNSMNPTYSSGDVVFAVPVGKLEIGDIVLAYERDGVVIKRVAGLPDNCVEARHGYLIINGERQGWYVGQGNLSNFSCTVPADSVFLIGDNPSNSIDSRFLGCFKSDSIIGRVVW